MNVSKRALSLSLVLLGWLAHLSADATALPLDALGEAPSYDWMAFARAEQRRLSGETFEFNLPSATNRPYAELHRAIWLGALHGLVNVKVADESTRRVLAEDLNAARTAVSRGIHYGIAVRDLPGAEKLVPALVAAQVCCRLVATNEACSIQNVLVPHGEEIRGERSNVVFSSVKMAVAFAQACSTDGGLVHDAEGEVAEGIFLRVLRDGRAVAVNLASVPRMGLVFRQGLHRQTFDLSPGGVAVLSHNSSIRLTRNLGEPFVTRLWTVRTGQGHPNRLIHDDLLPTVVDETYMGPVVYTTTIQVPRADEALYLAVDAGGEATSVLLGGHPLGMRAWEPFEWLIPAGCSGKTLQLEIRIDKKSYGGYLQSQPHWRRL